MKTLIFLLLVIFCSCSDQMNQKQQSKIKLVQYDTSCVVINGKLFETILDQIPDSNRYVLTKESIQIIYESGYIDGALSYQRHTYFFDKHIKNDFKGIERIFNPGPSIKQTIKKEVDKIQNLFND